MYNAKENIYVYQNIKSEDIVKSIRPISLKAQYILGLRNIPQKRKNNNKTKPNQTR